LTGRQKNELATLALLVILMVAAAGVAVGALFALGGCVETELTTREKRLERDLRKDVEDLDRYVDIGAIVRVVVADPNGAILLNGLPLMRVVREHRLGGMLDTRSEPPRLCGASRNPVVWHCSEDQEQVLFHDDPIALGQIIYGSEGAGKTRVLGMLHYVWWLELLGQGDEAGQTAPTKKRLKVVRDTMVELYPPTWYKYNVAAQVMTFADGHRVQFVSTRRVSEAQGSPTQGFNWRRAGIDELQDQLDALDDIESRGRTKGGSTYKQAGTCTAKASSAFVNAVAMKLASGDWIKRVMLIARSPFIDPVFLEKKRRVMTDREFRRRYEAEDLPPERMLYFNWERETHLRAIPHNAKKCTSYVLRQKTKNPRHALLAGHDPGTAKAATIFLEAYEIPGVPGWVWWVRAEIFTQHKTTEQNGLALLKLARSKFGCNKRSDAELVHVRAHPYGQAEDKPSLDLYRIFRRVGLDVKAAQYKKDGKGTGLIKKDDRIEMVNSLLRNAAGVVRLYVECDKQGQPVAPKLVEAFETMERDEEGLAEQEKKDEHDKSDCPAALGYALWPFEKESAADLRAGVRRAA
jgi:hypothetical protein